MCGILLCVASRPAHQEEILQKATGDKSSLERRGPDASNTIEIDISNSLTATFSGYTLWLQGDSPATQPLIDSSGNIILWNGDVFYDQIGGEWIPKGLSDTQFLLQKLEITKTLEEVCSILESINGPWALIYYKKSLNVIITGRDRFGRHSLLWNHSNSDEDFSFPLVISSSAQQQGTFHEIPASNLYQISFTSAPFIQSIYTRKPYIINKQLPLDHQLLNLTTHIEENNSCEQMINNYLKIWEKAVEEFEITLLASIKTRVFCQPMLCKACVLLHQQNRNAVQQCPHSKLAILFSGGLDSSVLAALADRVWPENESIDLLNVAFPLRSNNPLVERFNVPDRLTGLQALKELQSLNPTRKWNFIEVNVELEELVEMRKSRIAALIHPSSTVLDDSIGCAQWFAARGKGHLTGHTKDETYVSPARVVLMGAGADEQMAGYARHRQRFANGGWSLLLSEVEMEMNRISERNLGRDNRIIADHGRAPRLPYLDERVVEYLAQLPISAKVDLRLPIGLGDKIILRALASRLGLKKTVTEPKRAIQFGSRIAKTEVRKEKGSHVCDRLKKSLVLND